MTKLIAPVSPGEMLEEEFLVPLGMSKYRLAKRIGVSTQVMKVAVILLVMFLALMVASPVLADSWKDCASKNTDRSIKGCSALIKAGHETKVNRAIAYYNRGIAYAKNGLLKLAILDLDQSIVLRPKSADAHYNLGLAHYQSGNFDQAINDYDQAIKINSKYANAYGNRGVVHAAMSNYDSAITDYDRAITLDPKNGYSFYGRGNSYFAKGQYEKALVDLRKALALIPSSDKWNSDTQKLIAEIEEKMTSPN